MTEHEKGKDYAHLIQDFDKYPLILDKDDNVLSMPPIINGELTKLKEDTKNIIVDVTGTAKISYSLMEPWIDAENNARIKHWIQNKKPSAYAKDGVKKKGSLCPCGTIILREN